MKEVGVQPGKVLFVRLIGQKREELWDGQTDFSRLFGEPVPGPHQGPRSYGPVEHLAYIKEKRGEMIVALDPGSGAILGWIAIFPDRDEGGIFYHLAGIEVREEHRGRGLGAALMDEARQLLERHKSFRLRFGTSPVLTGCARLYITRFGSRYWWKPGVRAHGGRLWPYVGCECDFDDPLFKPLDLRDEQVVPRSVLDWDGARPVPRAGVVYSGPLSVTLPAFSASALSEAAERFPGFLSTLYEVFDALHAHGYGFAWFDRITHDNAPLFYYVMNKVSGL